MVSSSKIFILFVIISAQFLLSVSFARELPTINYDISNGLPDRLVRDLKKGPNGALWVGTRLGLSKFDGFEFSNNDLTAIYHKELKGKDIVTLEFDASGTLWIGTGKNGLYSLSKGKLTGYSSKLDSKFNSIRAIKAVAKGVWIATSKGLIFFNGQNFIPYDLGSSANNNITQLLVVNDDEMLIGSFSGLHNFNLKKRRISKQSYGISSLVLKLFHDSESVLISTRSNLYKLQLDTNKVEEIYPEISLYSILSIEKSIDGYWFGTVNNGLFRVSQNGEVVRYKSEGKHGHLSDNTITSILNDESGGLWLGTFNKGLDYLKYQNFEFYIQRALESSCATKHIIRNFSVLQEQLLLATNQGVMNTDTCQLLTPLNSKRLTNNTASDFYVFEDVQYSNLGRHLIEVLPEGSHYKIVAELPAKINFIMGLEKNLLIGTTRDGIYQYNPYSNKLNKIDPDSSFSNATFYQGVFSKDQGYYFVTNKGLLGLNDDFRIYLPKQFQVKGLAINSIYLNAEKLWVAGNSNNIYGFNLNSPNDSQILELPKVGPSINVKAINHSYNSLWATTNRGIFKIEQSGDIRHYTKADGLSSDSYISNSSFKSTDGKLYFGGRGGFDAFYPNKIKPNVIPPKVILTGLNRFNETVEFGRDYDGFSIEKPIEYLDEIELGYRDYVIGFEFAALHYADPLRNKYQYKLDGFHEGWVTTDAKNRTATFTNLKPGEYTFRVKATNKDGIWSLEKENVALKIRVNPAPWLSWWAYTIYACLFIASILWFIRYKTKTAIARAQELEKEVASRTKEIETQKNVIESLLERKNELFANISHEFRTPLTLILGPLEKELRALDSPKNPKHLKMIQRNAARLLGMVEQILKLTELKKEESVSKVPYSVNPALEAIVESFESLAESKNIELSLQLDINANILAAKDALEVMVGNLVSNAIKYTPESGKVAVTAKLLNKKIQISVTDSGVGMTQKQKEEVFERFVRLDKTSDIAGTGIGLSIVKELILAHDGEVSVDSVEGQGSTFTINLPTTEQAALSLNQDSLNSIGHLTAKIEESDSAIPVRNDVVEDNGLNTILVIEDNKDMQEHIVSTLDEYQCITADRGQAGLDLAQDKIPDLVICDVMMPGMDGYEVAKRLRDDERTSHIPIVLLTAKGDKESRIQGWNENIDDYMTKPFDERELKIRLSNILAIRNILGSKVGEIVVKEKEFLDKKDSLNKRDALFLERLKADIEKNFGEQGYARSAMASSVALSERQFQRKLKALVNKTPMELLREYRLNKAAEFLKDGDQVGVVADKCGFGSISHFSISFKAFYEKTPKQYQSEAIS